MPKPSANVCSGHGVSVRAFENELGVQAPLGFWDPAGLSSDPWMNDVSGTLIQVTVS